MVTLSKTNLNRCSAKLEVLLQLRHLVDKPSVNRGDAERRSGAANRVGEAGARLHPDRLADAPEPRRQGSPTRRSNDVVDACWRRRWHRDRLSHVQLSLDRARHPNGVRCLCRLPLAAAAVAAAALDASALALLAAAVLAAAATAASSTSAFASSSSAVATSLAAEDLADSHKPLLSANCAFAAASASACARCVVRYTCPSSRR